MSGWRRWVSVALMFVLMAAMVESRYQPGLIVFGVLLLAYGVYRYRFFWKYRSAELSLSPALQSTLTREPSHGFPLACCLIAGMSIIAAFGGSMAQDYQASEATKVSSFSSSASARKPSAAPTPTTETTQDVVIKQVAGREALTVLNSLDVKDPLPVVGFSESEFGEDWGSVNRGNCDMRNHILRRDLKDVIIQEGTNECGVLAGDLVSPYTGEWMRFEFGQDMVGVDHVVSLSDAWQKGAANFPVSTRNDIATDPMNLLVVDAASLGQKAHNNAAGWLPAHQSFQCEYVARQIGVKAKYGLWVSRDEKAAMTRVLNSCSGQKIPAADQAPDVEPNGPKPQPEPQPEPTPVVEAAPSQPQPLYEPAPAYESAPVYDPAPAYVPDPAPAPTRTYYKNCTEAREAGAAPIHFWEPGYGVHLDRDRDGIACEPKP
ncbi:excalibur calcium-binding domain-containing protein [Trueperella sp. LYQ141]|uniref:excalibur calcium-binding domain-containing protein n=1 Tax=Trueperella sp. LYQ141 TaxID=3391058 RepID=UPI00398360B6